MNIEQLNINPNIDNNIGNLEKNIEAGYKIKDFFSNLDNKEQENFIKILNTIV